jgi:hypothetical protein
MAWSRDHQKAKSEKAAALRDLAAGREPVRKIAARYGVDPKALRDLERAQGIKPKRRAGRPSPAIPHLEQDFIEVAKAIIKLGDSEVIAQLVAEQLWAWSFPEEPRGRVSPDPKAKIYEYAKQRKAVADLLAAIRSPASLALVGRIYGTPIDLKRRDGESAFPKESRVKWVRRKGILEDARAMRAFEREAPAEAQLTYDTISDPENIRLSVLPLPSPLTPSGAPRASWDQVAQWFCAVEGRHETGAPLPIRGFLSEYQELGRWSFHATKAESQRLIRWLKSEPQQRWRAKAPKRVRDRIKRLARHHRALAAQLEELVIERVRKPRSAS